MQALNLKTFSNILFLIAFVCGIFMLTGRTFGYRTEIHTVFFLTGAVALVMSLVASRQEISRGDFNILYWIGNLIIFIGLLLKTYNFHYDTYVIFGGIAISAISYFVNPFSNERDQEQEDELLDQ